MQFHFLPPFLKPVGHLATNEPSSPKLTPDTEEVGSEDEDEEYPPSSWNQKNNYGRTGTSTSFKTKSGKVATGDIFPRVGHSRTSLSSARGYPPTIEEERGGSEEEAEDEIMNEVISADYEMVPDMDVVESEGTRRTSPEFIAAPNSRGWTQSTKSHLRSRSSRREFPLDRVAPYDTRISRSPPSPRADRDRRASTRTPTKCGRRSRPKPDFPKAPSRRPGIAEGSFHIPPLPSPVEPLGEEQVKDLQNMAEKVFLALSMAERPCRKDELVWLIEKLVPEHRNPGWRGWEVCILS
jgi:hypothetical protein